MIFVPDGMNTDQQSDSEAPKISDQRQRTSKVKNLFTYFHDDPRASMEKYKIKDPVCNLTPLQVKY